ncbi:HSP-interacting, SSA1 ATPase activity-stimulating, TPR-containing co-chaperone [Reticulomyxa filosa]|uniref:HSP-interacting, SSA1 ATPase activity-stimulating, TPR-containing co-chaperone n=1 Tax=Reticulomyxa filosa TaxID=46433 RepID=X6N138_RETFI|nr:HSP-interacting, SSA1 ATPase activity-stimulating, TPR-containing co-chaperone [Reticulomyxa filosa]|eukprot:ETO19628.1 HSP-interacting, SSA1 ATPase activity-stimulating, TPR-containing co-chaperone [Reticulomyxa filosa]
MKTSNDSDEEAEENNTQSRDSYDPTDLSDWRNIPLFSDNLHPENPMAQAIKKLQEETTPETRAKKLKKSGNKAYGLGPERYNDAIKYYTRALETKCSNHQLNAEIYCNRGMVHLKLENFGKCIEDCKECLKIDDKMIKAYHRCSLAMLQLQKYEDALKMANKGREIAQQMLHSPPPSLLQDEKKQQNDEEKETSSSKTPPSRPMSAKEFESVFAKLAEKIEGQWNAQKEKERLKKEEETKQETLARNKHTQVQRVLSHRKYKFGKDLYNTLAYSNDVDWKQQDQSSMDITNADLDKVELAFNVLFVYPEFDQSDFIQGFTENAMFIDHLNRMLPPLGDAPSWLVSLKDHTQHDKYVAHNCMVFYQDKFGLMKDVHTTMKLKQVLANKHYVIPRIPVFFIIPKNSSFLELFLTSHQQTQSQTPQISSDSFTDSFTDNDDLNFFFSSCFCFCFNFCFFFFAGYFSNKFYKSKSKSFLKKISFFLSFYLLS